MAALQTSGKCSHTQRMLGTTTFPIGLRLALEPDLES